MTSVVGRGMLHRERILVVGDGGRLADMLRQRYPDREVSSRATYLSGISDLVRHPAQVVIAYVEPGFGRLDAAVAGLREAAGHDVRVVLCCPPEAEPQTRRVIGRGADDYVVYPVQTADLDRAIGGEEPGGTEADGPRSPTASMDELRLLAEALASLDAAPSEVLGKLADALLTAMGSGSVTISVRGSAATRGEGGAEAVLVEPIEIGEQVVGQIALGARRGRPYGRADSEKVRHYATLSGHVLSAAFKHRDWRELALTDEVTGLPNRRYLHQFLEELIERARREQFRVTMLVFDIDDFKTYNDTFGHPVGDEVLRLTGELFRRHCREHDVVVRYGGDEFAVVFWDAELPRVAGSRHPDSAMAVLARCTEALRNQECPMLGPNARGRLTVSGGLATFPWHADSASTLIQRADEALLMAKSAGKNRIHLIGADVTRAAD